MSTQPHSEDPQNDSALMTLSWIGGTLIVAAIFAFFYMGM